MPKKRTYKVFNKDGKKIFTGTSAEINDEAQQREVMPAWAKEWDEVRKKILAYG